MADFPFEIVGFDLDGTLIDTSEDLRASCNHALALADIAPLTNAQIRSAIGGGARRMLERGISLNASRPVSAALFEQMFDAFLTHYEANIAVHSQPFPATLAMMDELDAMGVKMAVVTNKLERLAELLFGALGLRHRFAAFLGRDSLGIEKAKPAPDLIHEMIRQCGGGRAVFVGDSAFDIGAARAAAIPCVAVGFGFLEGPVEELEADLVIEDFAALIPALRTLAR
jgi:phosphoglycolate phosphatase